MTDELATGTIRELDHDECLDLLGVSRLARIGFLLDGTLQIYPANIVAVGSVIFLRTGEDSLLSELPRVDQLVVQTDYHDDTYQNGWSLLVRGVASPATDEQLAELDEVTPPLRPWAGGDREIVLAIALDEISGRRVRSMS